MRVLFRMTGLMACVALVSSACSVLGAAQQPTQTLPPTTESLPPSSTPEDLPAPEATLPTSPFAAPAKGDLLFVAGGQIWTITAAGANKRALTSLPDSATVTELTVSPNGLFAGYVINGTLVEVLDLTSGNRITIDSATTNRFDNLVWATDGSVIYYHKLLVNEFSVPLSSEIWKVAFPPISAPERLFQSDLSTGLMTVPESVVDGGLVLLHQFGPNLSGAGNWFTYDPSTATSTPVAEGFGVWDAVPGNMLLFDKNELVPGHLSVPIALYEAPGSAPPAAISPFDDDQAAYTQASFGPETTQIAVIRYTQTADGVVGSGAALLQLGQSGSYDLVLIPADASAQDVAVTWVDSAHAIVQRLRGDVSELWLFATDGSAGTLLTEGEQAQVVGG